MPSVPVLSSLMRELLVNRQPDALAEPLPPLMFGKSMPPQGSKRIKLWELEHKHHCPVIGTCLRMDDLVRFARRYKFAADCRDEFALHVEAVGWCQSRNEVSEALQKHLDRKYETWIACFAKLKTDADVRAAWKKCLAKGEVGGPLWATCAHKAASAETRQEVYADIHMLSHQVGAGQAADARRLGYLEKENAELKRALEAECLQHQAQTSKLQARLSALEDALNERAALSEEFTQLRERVGHFESGAAMAEMEQRMTRLQRTNEQLTATAQRVSELEKSLHAIQQEAAESARQRDAVAAQRDALERLLTGTGRDADCAAQCECCEYVQSHRCVLYVGGRASLVAQYRELAERLGVRLVHHDGGQEEALSRLPELIRSADAVICPTDCVSHSAYYNLKNHCKRTGKPCLFFKGAGVSSFAVAMARLSRGEFSLTGQMDSASCQELPQ